MSKRKKNDPNPEEEDDDDDYHSRDKNRQQQPQKVYDFHKKTIEVYPERLRELNRQFVSSISSQITTEPYSVLVGNCLDYVRQYFKYEDDFLQYSPWLATRLKQSRSDIVKCLQETIDVYEALARHDFDRIINKNNIDTSSGDSITNRTDNSAQSTTIPTFPFRSSTTTTISSSLPSSSLTTTTAIGTIPATSFSFAKTTTTTATSDSTSITNFNFAKTTASTTTAASDVTPITSFSFAKSTATTTTVGDSTPITTFSFAKTTTTTATSELTPITSFSFAKSTATTTPASESTPITSFSFAKSTASTTTASESTPTTGFTFAKSTPITSTTGSTPAGSFNFKMPTTTASPEKTANASPFAFSIPSTGFGTSTFTSPFSNPPSTDKSTTSSASSISFIPPKFSFTQTPSATGGEQPGTADDAEDEPSEPPEPEKVDHEADAKLTYRCRMGVKKSDKLVKRGPVQVILKEVNEKRQLIVRSDDALGRLYLNIIWSKSIQLKKNSTKDLTFGCMLNPSMTEFEEGAVVVILFRFDNETERNDAYDKLTKERT